MRDSVTRICFSAFANVGCSLLLRGVHGINPVDTLEKEKSRKILSLGWSDDRLMVMLTLDRELKTSFCLIVV